MSHAHAGGKKATKKRLTRNEHRIEVLRRRERLAQARMREVEQQHDKAVKALSSLGLLHHNVHESLRALIQRGARIIRAIPDKRLRYHMEHAFLARMAYLRAHEKAGRTKKRIAALRSRNLTKRTK